MTRKTSNHKNTIIIALTITLISLVTITSFLATGLSISDSIPYGDAVINAVPKQPSPPIYVISNNETGGPDAINNSYSSAPLVIAPNSLDTSKPIAFNRSDLTRFFGSLQNEAIQSQIAMSDAALPIHSTATMITTPTSLENMDFVTYTYGGYSVQQPQSTQFLFSFPDCINQGELAGSDVISINMYLIQKIEFNATFIASQNSALGFDEMAVFAASNTCTYKGTEFGIRFDLRDGLIYGYIQEPDGIGGDVNFQMLQLMPNNGVIHHYSLIAVDSQVSFCIDGINYGYLSFPSNTDYSSLLFQILAVVHRFTDNWDSTGDNMTVENFCLNQP